MNYLSLDQVTKSFGERVLFTDITLGIGQGEKAALVGINGCGKSTLLKIIAGEEPADKGDVATRNGIQVAYLTQNPDFDPNSTILDFIFDSKVESLATIRAYEENMARVESGELSADTITPWIEKMDTMNLWDHEAAIKEILGKLGLNELDQVGSNLSGGQKKRAALAKVLIEAPDFIILDEPTNHLDLDAIEWLQKYLSRQQLSLLMVTHDRYFLDAVCNTIIEIDNQQTYIYRGNYAYYLQKKEEREIEEQQSVDKARNLLKKELEWLRRQPKARGTKAKYRVEGVKDLQQKATGKAQKDDLQLDVNAKRLGKKVLELDHLTIGYPDLTLINDMSYVFKRGDRIGLIGKNGTGKTSFLKTLTGGLSPLDGNIEHGLNTKVGYFKQEETLAPSNDIKVLDLVKQVAEAIEMKDGSVITASQLLLHFQFPPKQQHDFVYKLSGGERKRLQLLMVLIDNPNFLILDEPTNDLDIITLNILEDFLQNFPGCLLIVSHDRYFMDRLVEHLFVLEGLGKWKDFPGNYTDYRTWLDEQESEKPASTEKKKQNNYKSTNQKQRAPKLSYKEKQELQQLEKDIERLEEQKAELIEKLNAGHEDHSQLEAWSGEIAALDKQLETKSERWFELSEMEG